MSEGTTAYGFLCGADMAPGRIRHDPATSDSRFVDIGSVTSTSLRDLGLPLPDSDDVWGVVVTLSQSPGGPEGSVTLRTGDVVQATVLTTQDSFGAIEDVLAEAYYWELPRAWRNTLEAFSDETR